MAVVVCGEHPYAEFEGDVRNLDFTGCAARCDLSLLRRLRVAHLPVVSVFLSGRPLWVNPEIDASSAFVAAWLPGTAGEGVADALLRAPSGRVRFDFHGTLPFAWPRTALQFGLDTPEEPLFPVGYGLRDASDGNLAHLATRGGAPRAPRISARTFFAAGHSGAGWHWSVSGGAAARILTCGIGFFPTAPYGSLKRRTLPNILAATGAADPRWRRGAEALVSSSIFCRTPGTQPTPDRAGT